jgi:anion-transporting  ArsA/GET3 family ATPase
VSTQPAPLGLGPIAEGRSLIVVAGAGGVGKTTVSAALGMAAAEHLDGEVLVLTIDPARRLASALGMEIDGNDAVRVDHPTGGHLSAAMLDPGRAWDALVRQEAPDDDVADRILANPVYRRIADTFVHGNDYAALSWLEDAIASERYRLIIVDTPPSQNALDFFDAPQRVEEFFTSSLLNWLTGGESGSIVGAAATRTFGSLADRLLGSQFFSDIVEFFTLMQTVVPGMVERTSAVAEELAGDDAALLAVTAPAVASIERVGALVADLDARDLMLDGVVVNGVEPPEFWDAGVGEAAQRVLDGERSHFSQANTALLVPGAEYVLERTAVAAAQAAAIAELDGFATLTIPRTVHSPSNIAGLAALGSLLW